MKTSRFLKICLALIFVLIGCTGKDSPDLETETSLITWDDCGYEVGDHLCDFALSDNKGNTFSLYDHVGSPVVLDYSTMWCAYCQLAAKEVDSVSGQYSEHDLLYATVLIENQYGEAPSVSDCNLWAEANDIVENPVLAGDRSLIASPGQPEGVSIQGWPTFLFLNDDLTIQSVLSGFGSSAIDYHIQGIIPKVED